MGAHVTGYSLAPPTTPNLFELLGIGKKVISVIGDVRDYQKLLKTLQDAGPEVVIHMAAQSLVRESYLNPVETYAVNVMGTVNLLESVRQTDGIKAVLNITTDKCYENKEWFWGYREAEPLGGHDPYSSSKACSELVTAAYRRSFFEDSDALSREILVASARAGNVIGGGDWAKDRLIPDCIRSWSRGEDVVIRYPNAVRPWQHVLEPLSGYLLLIERLYKEGRDFAEAWNFGPNETDAEPVGNIVKQMAMHWGAGANYSIDSGEHPHEANFLKLDCSKSRSKLGWQPKWKLSKALERTTAWYLTYLNSPERLLQETLDQIEEYTNEV